MENIESFVGREKELSLISNWLKNPVNRLIMNFMGIGGVGKTKLATQLCVSSPTRTVLLDVGPSRIIHTPEQVLETIARGLFKDEILETYCREVGEIDYKSYSYLPGINANIYIGKGAVIQGDVKSEIKIKADKLVTKDERERRLQRHVELLLQLLSSSSENDPSLIIFDHFENIENDRAFKNWILQTFISKDLSKSLKKVGIIFFSRMKVIGSPSTQEITYYEIPNFNSSECETYMNSMGVENDEYRKLVIDLTKGHPYSMFLAMNLDKRILQDISVSPKLVKDETEEILVAQFLVDKILEYESDKDVKRALLGTAVLRIVNASSVAYLLNWKIDRAVNVIHKLEKRSFLIKVSNDGFWLYHDLLRDLLLKNLIQTGSRRGYKQIHEKALAYYLCIPKEDLEENVEKLISIIEPFYHLMEIDVKRGWEYFESEYKPRLDRREKDICRIFLSQINLKEIKNSHYASWFMFRIADFWREFGDYEKAIAEYKSLLDDFIPRNQIHDPKLVTSILNNIGWTYLFYEPEKNLKKSIEYSERALIEGRKGEFISITAMSLNNLGIAWERIGDFQKAKYYYKESLLINESEVWLENPAARFVAGMSRQNLGNVFAQEGDFEQSELEYNLAFGHYHIAKSIHYLKSTIMLYGILLIKRKEYDKAMIALWDALEFWRQAQDHSRWANTLFSLGVCHEAKEQYEHLFQAHAVSCQVSLFDSFSDHESLVIGGIIPFMRFLFIKRGKTIAKIYVDEIIKEWNSQEKLVKFELFPQFIQSQYEELTKKKYFVSDKKYHKIGCMEAKSMEYGSSFLFFEKRKQINVQEIIACELCLPSLLKKLQLGKMK